jgi:hypothetical protein
MTAIDHETGRGAGRHVPSPTGPLLVFRLEIAAFYQYERNLRLELARRI